MPSLRYMNASAPFWDWVANLEQQGANHPFFAGQNNEENVPEGDNVPFGPFGPWAWGPPPLGPPPLGPPPLGPPPLGPPPSGPPAWGPPGMPHHGLGPHHGPWPPTAPRQEDSETANEKDVNMEKEDNGEGPSTSGPEATEGFGPQGPWRHHGGRCGGRRGGRHGFGPHEHGHGPHGHGPHGPPGNHYGRRGFGGGRRGWGGPFGGWGGPFGGFGGGPFGIAGLANLFNPGAENSGEDKDFEPEVDIFDTPSSFIVHLSLPGAKKEDVGVNWDQEKSELSIAGVIYRPADEELLKTLAMDERKVGPFERKIRLGSRANPAQIDADGITAKLEDGVLKIDVPKEEAGFVEVRKVDIE